MCLPGHRPPTGLWAIGIARTAQRSLGCTTGTSTAPQPSRLTWVLYGYPAKPFKQNLGWLNSFLRRSVTVDGSGRRVTQRGKTSPPTQLQQHWPRTGQWRNLLAGLFLGGGFLACGFFGRWLFGGSFFGSGFLGSGFLGGWLFGRGFFCWF